MLYTLGLYIVHVGYVWTNYCHHSGLPDIFQQLLGIITSCQVIIIFPLRDSGYMTSRLLLGWLHGQPCSKPLVMNDLKSGDHTSHMRIAGLCTSSETFLLHTHGVTRLVPCQLINRWDMQDLVTRQLGNYSNQTEVLAWLYSLCFFTFNGGSTWS